MHTRDRLLLVFASLALLGGGSYASHAQGMGWTSPVQLSVTGQFSWFPDIAVDATGRVHVVWSSFVPGYDAVMYSSSDQDGIWSQPTDIIALPGTGAATRPTILFDPQGNAHLIGRNDNIMSYYRVPYSDLRFPMRWPSAREMGRSGGAYFSRLTVGRDDTLHFFATESLHAPECPTCYEILYRQSRDGGRSWTSPMLVSPAGKGAIKPQILESRSGSLHLVWDAGRGGGLAQFVGDAQVSYVVSRDGGKTWSDPVEFSGALGGFPGESGRFIAIGEDGAGKLIVAWLRLPDDMPQYQISSNDGLTWSAPTPLPGVFGTWKLVDARLDTYSMATDGAGNIHLVLVGRLDTASTVPSLLHMVWNGTAWLDPEVIYSREGITPVWPRIAIGLGNQLHVAWFTTNTANTESASADYRIWYARKTTSIPAIPTREYPTPTAAPLASATPVVTPPQSAPALNTLPAEVAFESLKTEIDDYAIVVISILPALLICVILLLLIARRHS